MKTIEINHLTKDYGHHKGVFDVSFSVNEGEILGFLGPNGSGKTTTIRHLMGFIKPDQGNTTILELDTFKQANLVQNQLGYLPGEIAFMEDMTAKDFIEFMAEMKNMPSMKKAKELMDYFELDSNIKIKKMSKGMKQKVALVIAFMQDAPILILDEPTSGLDPLMQNKFVELIKKEKAEGKTILMSSHIFEEIEHTCDRVVIIREGKIVAKESMENLKHHRHKHYEIVFKDSKDALSFSQLYKDHISINNRTVILSLKGEVNTLIQNLSHYDVVDILAREQSLEELFMHYYGGNDHD